MAAAALGWLLPQMSLICRLLRIPNPPRRWPVEWFPRAQVLLIAASAALGTWVSLDVAFDEIGGQPALFGLAGRVAGNLSAVLVLGAAMVMAAQSEVRWHWRMLWQYVAFAAAVLMLSSLGWARLDLTAGTPTGDAPWLHDSVVLMAAAVLVTLATGLGLRCILPGTSDWIAAGRRAAFMLGGLSLATLAAVLVQERVLFEPSDTAWLATWVAPWAIAVVAAAMVGLVAGCLAWALAPAWDPLRLRIGKSTSVAFRDVLLTLRVRFCGDSASRGA